MKKFSKRLFTSLVAFCMLFSVSAVPAFAAETTTEITDTQQPVVIGEYDGYLTDVMISDGVTKRAVANVRINSYATYDEDDGIQVHVKLYVPWYESPKPEFTGMTGTVNVLMNKKSTNTAFEELATVKKQSKLMWILEEQVIAEIRERFLFLVLLPLIMPWQAVELSLFLTL